MDGSAPATVRSKFSSFLGEVPLQGPSHDTEADLEKLVSDIRSITQPLASDLDAVASIARDQDAAAIMQGQGLESLGAQMDDVDPAAGLSSGVPVMPGSMPAMPGSRDAAKLMEYWTFTDQYGGDGGAGDNHVAAQHAHHQTSPEHGHALSHGKHNTHSHHNHGNANPVQPPPPEAPIENNQGGPVATVIFNEEDTSIRPLAVFGGMMAVFGQVYLWANVFVTLFKRDRSALANTVSANPRADTLSGNARPERLLPNSGAEQGPPSFSGASGQATASSAQGSPVTAES